MKIEIESSELLPRLASIGETVRYGTIAVDGYRRRHEMSMESIEELPELVRDAVVTRRTELAEYAKLEAAR